MEYQKLLQEEEVHNTSSDKGNRGRWSKDEHLKFVEALKLYGKDWKKVEDHIGTRSGA